MPKKCGAPDKKKIVGSVNNNNNNSDVMYNTVDKIGPITELQTLPD